MSEYWKSTPKYWCKHCSAYVKDTPFERKQHESTGKHQGNLKRFLRGIQNDHEKAEREKEKVKAEVDRLNKVVGAPVSSSGQSTSAPFTRRKSTMGAPTAADQKRQWQQLVEMGIQVPDNFRGEMALPGQWQTVSKQAETSPTSEISLSTGVRKRKLENEEEEENIPGSMKPRGWGTTTKRYPGEATSDLDALLSGPIFKKELTTKKEPTTQESLILSMSKPSVLADGTEDTKEPIKAEVDHQAIPDVSTLAARHISLKSENSRPEGQTTLRDVPQEPAIAPVFRKRKAKSKAGPEME